MAVDASSWSSYRGGILKCSSTRLNHGVTLVGTTEGNWHVKNSWGAGWGEKGFVRVTSDTKGNCGICNMAVYPTA